MQACSKDESFSVSLVVVGIASLDVDVRVVLASTLSCGLPCVNSCLDTESRPSPRGIRREKKNENYKISAARAARARWPDRDRGRGAASETRAEQMRCASFSSSSSESDSSHSF